MLQAAEFSANTPDRASKPQQECVWGTTARMTPLEECKVILTVFDFLYLHPVTFVCYFNGLLPLKH